MKNEKSCREHITENKKYVSFFGHDFCDVPRLTETFFPLGFPLKIQTNHKVVLDIARQSWGVFKAVHNCKPLQLTLFVDQKRVLAPLEIPQSRIEGNFLKIFIDETHFLKADLKCGTSFGIVGSSLLDKVAILRYCFLEAAALSMISTLHAVALHAACVVSQGQGFLLCGESGAGKTSLAYACARAGWSYLSDDASYLMLNGSPRIVTGNPYSIRFRDVAHELFPELKGKSITPRVLGKPSIEVTTKELPAIQQVENANIKYILFLNRSEAALPGICSVTRERALMYFSKFLLQPLHESSKTAIAIQKLMQARIFELRYSNLNWAVEQMSHLVER